MTAVAIDADILCIGETHGAQLRGRQMIDAVVLEAELHPFAVGQHTSIGPATADVVSASARSLGGRCSSYPPRLRLFAVPNRNDLHLSAFQFPEGASVANDGDEVQVYQALTATDADVGLDA